YLGVNSIDNGSEAVWGALTDNSYWNIENTDDGYITIQSCATGKYLTDENGVLVQKNYIGESNQIWRGDDFELTRLTELKDVVITPDSISITANGIETDTIVMESGEEIQLGVEIKPEGAKAAITWSSDSIGSGVVTPDGRLTAYASGKFAVTATADAGYSVCAKVRVIGNSRNIEKAEIAAVSAADDGYNSSWKPENAFDGVAATAYSSKDDKAVKYVQAELTEPKALTRAYITGRYTAADGNGAFANRINGAKIYASNEDMNGIPDNGVLVGRVEGVSATSAYVPQCVEINTDGIEYKYYMVYFDTVNNGANISMALSDIDFYTGGGGNELKKILPAVTAAGGANPEYAVDGRVSTVFTVANQTADTIENQYIQFELDGVNTVNKIVIKKAILSGESNYWADWCLAVGCELQGSFDGEDWETVAVMNTWPDGTDNLSEAVFEFSSPKAYKYIRYIRTKVKTNSDYAGWKWADYGNRLSIADIEFFTVKPCISAEIISVNGTAVKVSAESNVDGKYTMLAA
ncbi:MAG: discoidin domain-containing protein, partial [Clostridia bacterium]